MSTPDERRAGGRPGWPFVIVASLLSVFVLTVGWKLSVLDEHTGPGEGPWRRGGHGPPDLDLRAWSLPGVLAVVLSGVGILAMRRWPRAGFVLTCAGLALYGALGGLGTSVIAPLALAVLLLTCRAGPRRAWPLLALLPLVLWAKSWDESSLGLTDPGMWAMLVSGLVWVLLPALVAQLVRGRREAASRSRAEELERVAHAERLRVVRDIHDVVGHSLSMITLQAGVALRVLDDNPAQTRASLEAIRSSSKEALDEVRHTLGLFRGEEGPLAPTPGLAGITKLVEDVRRSGVDVRLATLPDPASVPSSVGTVAFRVVREALTNAVRHAPGNRVVVALSTGAEESRAAGDDVLRVVVSDHGSAPAHPLVEGGGLRGMRERVEALAGRLSVTAGGDGVEVSAVLPLPGKGQP